MTSPGETARDHQMVPEDDQIMPEDDHMVPEGMPEGDQIMPEESTSDPAGAIAAGDPPSPAPAASEHPGATAVGGAAEEPGTGSRGDAERPSAVSAPGGEPGSIRESAVASGSTSPSGRWREIQAMFVDDPRSSIELAAGLVDDSVEALVVSVKERQHSLLSAWQRDDAGTEEMRIALQHYRTFWNRLEDFCREP